MSKCSSDLQLLSALFTGAQSVLFAWLYSTPEQVSYSSNISKTCHLQGNFNTTVSSFNVWGPHMIISAPPIRLGHILSSALCITLSSCWLHSTVPAALAAHHMVLANSGCWVLLLQLGLTHSLPYACSMVPMLSCSAWELHELKISTTFVILTHDQVQLHH